MHKFNEWSVNRRIESLRQMDKKLSEMEVASRYTIWQNYGGGLKATADETHANWKRIAEITICISMLFFAIWFVHWKVIRCPVLILRNKSATRGKGNFALIR